jgi:hypothetical protein
MKDLSIEKVFGVVFVRTQIVHDENHNICMKTFHCIISYKKKMYLSIQHAQLFIENVYDKSSLVFFDGLTYQHTQHAE